MDKLTITAIEAKGTWQSQYGTMYESWVTLSDGRSGMVNSKSADVWKVGDAIEIKEATPGKYGLKLKIGKWQEMTTAPTNRNSEEIQTRIDASWAIGQAVAMGAHNDSPEDFMKKARWLLAMRDYLIKVIKTTNDDQKPAEQPTQQTTEQPNQTPNEKPKKSASKAGGNPDSEEIPF